MKMRFYRGNRLDGEFERDVTEVAAQFWNSSQARLVHQGMMLDRALRDFLTDPDGFNSTWDSEIAYADLHMLVRASWPKTETAEVDMAAPRDRPPVQSTDRDPGGS